MIVFKLAKNEFKQLIRDWAAVLILFALPFLFIGLFAGAVGPYLTGDRFAERFAIALVDNDDSVGSRMLIQQFESSSNAKGYITVYHTDETSALGLIRSNKICGIIVIPTGFVDSVTQGSNKPLTFIANPAMRKTADLIKNELASAVNLVSAGQSGILSVYRYTKWGGADQALVDQQFQASVYKFTMGALGRGKLFAEETVSDQPDVTPAEYFTAALVSLFASFVAMRGVKSLIEEKNTGLKARIMVSPIEPWQLLAGKGLFTFILVGFQLIVVVLASGLLFKTYLGGPAWAMIMMFAASAFAVTSWALFIAACSPSPQSADLIAYMGTPLLCLIGGSIYPLSSLPPAVRSLSGFTFNRWIMDGFMKVFAGEPVTAVNGDMLWLLGIGCALLALAGLSLRLTWRFE